MVGRLCDLNPKLLKLTPQTPQSREMNRASRQDSYVAVLESFTVFFGLLLLLLDLHKICLVLCRFAFQEEMSIVRSPHSLLVLFLLDARATYQLTCAFNPRITSGSGDFAWAKDSCSYSQVMTTVRVQMLLDSGLGFGYFGFHGRSEGTKKRISMTQPPSDREAIFKRLCSGASLGPDSGLIRDSVRREPRNTDKLNAKL